MRVNKGHRTGWLLYAVIVVMIHIIGIALLLLGAKQYSQIIEFGFLAYTLGLRHAFDVDHIASIDNIVRKLIQYKKKPEGVGFFFSLGHASVVFIMAIVTVLYMKWARNNLPFMKEIGSLIGTSVSGVFLVLIGLLNLFIWIDILKFFIHVRSNQYDAEQIDLRLQNKGFMTRFLAPLYRLIGKSWHAYPIGFLFGLGFDTASEVALLAVSVTAATQMLPFRVIIALPILFAAGMSLMDTADGVFMVSAYNWAFATPLRKIYYNLSVTGLSVIAALIIGFIELTQIIAPKLGLRNGVWKLIIDLDLGHVGYLLIGLFILCWAISYITWKVLRLEKA